MINDDVLMENNDSINYNELYYNMIIIAAVMITLITNMLTISKATVITQQQ